MSMLLYQSGDIETNPGPNSSGSSERDSSYLFPPLHGNFSLVHYNIQSVLNKLDIIEPELSSFDIIALTETWLNNSVSTDDLLFTNFQSPFRRDRVGDSHGGVMVYVKHDIPCKRRHDLELLTVECLWLEIAVKSKKMLIGTFYRPPNSSPTILSDIESSIGLAIDTGIPDIVITGDFNFNVLNPASNAKITSICQQYNLHQLITEPTNFTEFSSTIIDLILVSNLHSIEMSGVGEPFLLQDTRYHCPVFSIFSFKKSLVKTFSREIWLYERGDYEQLRQKVHNFNWNSIKHTDIDIYTSAFTDQLLNMAKECIPNKTVRVRPHDLPWMNGSIRKIMRKRNRSYRKYKQNKTKNKYEAYKHLRNEVTKLLRQSKRNYLDSLASKLKSSNFSSSEYWKTLKSFIKPASNTAIPPLLHDGNYYSESSDKADILNDFFIQQTDIDDSNNTLPDDIFLENNALSNIVTTPDEVKSVLQNLKLGKSSGPDNINNKLLKELANQLSIPLCDIFNSSLHSSTCPNMWKQAHVTPIYKKDNPSLAANYRPISLLSTIGKVLERIIHKHMFNFFNNNNIITCLQSGFLPGDSSVNQLVSLYNTFCRALDDGKEVRAIFCDISKAFDRVWHRGLLYKLKRAGIKGPLLAWLSNYLSNRKQRVVLPGGSSRWQFIKAGVPQGSILGPLLFLLYINDIVSDIHSSIRLFADDTSLYIIVDNPDAAARTLNTDLDTIHNWAETWLVKFNPSKSESLLVSRKSARNVHPPLFMNNQIIPEVTSHKHLGIFLAKDGTWHEHIDFIISKAWQRVNVMRKLKFLIDRDSLNKIYTSFIRPVLEYADVVWDNCSQYELNAIEKIQLESARIITGATKLVSIDTLYRESGLEPLNKRRYKHKMCMFYKIMNDLTPTYLVSLIPESIDNTMNYNLRNSQNIRPIRARTQLYYRSFVPSGIREWNELPLEIRNSSSLLSFKNTLNKNVSKPPSFYSSGLRKFQIHHTRLRTKCSALNEHLHCKNLIDNPRCVCGATETTKHFLLECTQYDLARAIMLDKVSTYCVPDLNVLLFGDIRLSNSVNEIIFKAVQQFIADSRRFSV